MKQQRDVGSFVLAAAVLLLCVNYMTQCSSATHRTETVVAAPPSEAPTKDARAHAERERKPKSAQELAAEEENEERAKLKSISRALQTIGADPEMRRTYGLPE